LENALHGAGLFAVSRVICERLAFGPFQALGEIDEALAGSAA
jgi:hypothetical protein